MFLLLPLPRQERLDQIVGSSSAVNNLQYPICLFQGKRKDQRAEVLHTISSENSDAAPSLYVVCDDDADCLRSCDAIDPNKMRTFIFSGLNHVFRHALERIFSASQDGMALVLRDCTFSPQCMAQIAIMARHLHSLIIQKCPVNDEGAIVLSAQLASNTMLKVLDLTRSGIGSNGSIAIARILNNGVIRSLSLKFNTIGNAGTAAISASLKANNYLRTLNLSYAEIGNVGLRKLAKCLTQNTTLTDLNISGNNIGKDGAAVLMSAAQHNDSLCSLCLYNNNLQDDGMHAVIEALPLLKLRTLDVGYNNISPSTERSLIETLRSLDVNGHIDADAGRATLHRQMRSGKEMMLSFCMGTHKRLGQDSVIYYLHLELADKVLQIYIGLHDMFVMF